MLVQCVGSNVKVRPGVEEVCRQQGCGVVGCRGGAWAAVWWCGEMLVQRVGSNGKVRPGVEEVHGQQHCCEVRVEKVPTLVLWAAM